MATKRSKGTREAGRALFQGRGSEAVGAVVGGGARKRGPAPRGFSYTRALYRFREDQLEKLRGVALEQATRQGVAAVDISALLRGLVDEWIAKGCPLPKGTGGKS